MKKVFFLLVPVLYCMCFAGCGDDEEFPEFPTPAWAVNHAEYSVSMSAVVTLPGNLSPYWQTDDVVAAFSGESCRGLGEFIDGVYFIVIKGTPEEQSNITFRYYSARNKYLYQTPGTIAFEPDDRYGSIDSPIVLNLQIVK